MPSFTKSLPFFRDLIDVTLADEDAHSKVVDVFGVENDAGDRIGDSFVIDDSLATA